MKRSRFPLAVVVLVSIVLSVSVSAQEKEEKPAASDVPLVAEKVRQLMQDREYAEAIRAIDEAARAKDAPKDYLVYLKGRALYLQGEYDQAVPPSRGSRRSFPKVPGRGGHGSERRWHWPARAISGPPN